MSTRRLSLSAAALALLLAAASGPIQAQAQTTMAAKETPPAPQPPREVRFPEVVQKTLPNGLRVVVLEHHEQPAVSLQLIVPAGKVYDPPAKAGLAEAASTLLTKGTASRSAQQIAQAIDDVGGSLSASPGWDSANAAAQVTTDQIDLGLELLSDIVMRPSFPAEEVERWRRQALNALQINQQDPSYLASAVFNRAAFGTHPYGQPESGTPESVGGLTRDDLVAFHKTHFVANGAMLAVVGDVNPQEALAKVERYFGSWAKGEKAPEVPVLKASGGDRRRILVVDKPDAVQTQVYVGQVGIAYRDPDFYPARVYGAILGGGVSSRLYREIRRDRGLAYGAYSGFQEQYQPGPFIATTSTKTESTIQALGLILDNIEKMATEPVPKQELEARKTYLTGTFVRQMEIPESIAGQLIQAMFNGYGKERIEAYRDQIEAVQAADVQRFAKERIHPDTALVVLVGNAAGFRDELEKKLGKFETIPYADVDLLRADLRKPQAAAVKPAS